MKVRFTPQAIEDLGEIADYIRERSPKAAVSVRKAIMASVQILIRFPHSGRQQTSAGIRKLVAQRYPYLIYYRVHEERQQIEILAIRHPARARSFSDE